MEKYNDTVIWRDDGVDIVSIFTKTLGVVCPIPADKLQWRKDKDAEEAMGCGDHLTLQEIGDQIHDMTGCRCPLYVWVESTLSGKIYQTGNYKDDAWLLHGETKGYA